MAKNDGWPVVKRSAVIFDGVHDTVKWCSYRRSRRLKHVDTKMDGPPFRNLIADRQELIGTIRRSDFVVPTQKRRLLLSGISAVFDKSAIQPLYT